MRQNSQRDEKALHSIPHILINGFFDRTRSLPEKTRILLLETASF